MTAPPGQPYPDGMTVQAVTSAESCTVTVRGDVDTDSAPDLRACLLDVLARPDVSAVELDLTGVTFLDSAGLTTLVIAHQAAQEAERVLRMRCGTAWAVVRPLEITGLTTIFTIVDA